MLSTPEKVLFSLVILATVILFLLPVVRYVRIICAGHPEKRFRRIPRRFWEALTKVFFQRCTLKNERVATGFMHVLIFYGALTFDTMTINHTLEGFIPGFFLFGSSRFGLFFSLLVDAFAVLVLVGVGFLAFRRYIIRPKAYATGLLDSGMIYLFITLATLSYLYFECFSIAAHPETERLAFLGGFLFRLVQASGMSAGVVASHFKVAWWLHILIVFAFISYVPHSKYFHMFAGPVNVFFSSDRSTGELLPLDLEHAEVFGIEKSSDYTWKDFLDCFACMECGRCQEACPAFTSDKPLSPKMIIYNLKRSLLRDRNPLVSKQREEISPLMEGVYTEGEIWTCTTCGACMHVCPVEIEHIPKIIGVRQSQVLMESKFPNELTTFFRNMETNSNPWGIGFAARADWARGLDVPLISENPGVDVLFYVGCAGSFDEEGKKVARAMVSLLSAAGVRFGILGTEENCCGDSARRLGNEYLFQLLASENLSLFRKYGVKKVVTFCPHGYHVLKHEYPKVLNVLPDFSEEDKAFCRDIEVVHAAEMVFELLERGQLRMKKTLTHKTTYHDSCYLARHNQIIRQPRGVLQRLAPSSFVELGNAREHSFCCGGGGGLMWTEESLGVRINHLRVDEILGSGAELAVTSCPFCLTMLQDALKDKEAQGIQVKDLVQVVAESLEEG